MSENIILVDKQGNRTGVAEKMHVHKSGLLHRAFSIFIFNSNGDLLLQKRAEKKYHSGGLWTNSCCSHQREGESLMESAHRRLKEEMGFDVPLEEKFAFSYQATFDNGLIENEYDHVLVGFYDRQVDPDRDEVDAYRWVAWDVLCKDVQENPDLYTAWFKEILKFIHYERKTLFLRG